MPTARIQTPDGRIITLEVPEGATQEQILSFVQSQQPAAPVEPAAAQPSSDPRVQLQDLLIRQAQGEQGLEQQIAQLRQSTGEVSDPALSERQTPGLLSDISSGLQTAANVATGIGGEILAGARGVGAEIASPIVEAFGGQPISGAETVKQTREAAQQLQLGEDDPRVQEFQQNLGTAASAVNIPIGGLSGALELATTGDIGRAADVSEAVQKKGFSKVLGESVLEETGSPLAATVAELLPSAASEFIGFRGLSKTRNKRLSRGELTIETVPLEESVRQARKASEQSGIGLFKAQQTLNPTDIERQAFISTLPSGAKKGSEALRKQNTESFNAVNEFLNELAPPESITRASENFRSASQQALSREKLIRKAKTSPLYKEAFKNSQPTELKPVRDFINSELSHLPDTGEIAKSLNKVKVLVRDRKGGMLAETALVEPRAVSLKKLHNTKLEIDQMLNKFGGDSLGNTTKAKLAELKDILVTQIDAANPQYKKAREAFEAASPAVNKLNDSIIGAISGMDDIQLKNISRRIFDPAETNPEVIRLAKKTINDVDPDAWNTLLRSELERRMGRMRAELGDLDTLTATENLPSQLFTAVFGNKKSRDVLFKSVDGDLKKNLAYLEVGLRRASKGRPGGSQTALRQEIKKELTGGLTQTVRDFFRQPLATAAGLGEDVAFDKKVKVLSDVLFDPQWKEEMKKIRKFKPSSKTAQEMMADLLNSALIAAPAIEEQ